MLPYRSSISLCFFFFGFWFTIFFFSSVTHADFVFALCYSALPMSSLHAHSPEFSNIVSPVLVSVHPIPPALAVLSLLRFLQSSFLLPPNLFPSSQSPSQSHKSFSPIFSSYSVFSASTWPPLPAFRKKDVVL